jgi:hypothetical protein
MIHTNTFVYIYIHQKPQVNQSEAVERGSERKEAGKWAEGEIE